MIKRIIIFAVLVSAIWLGESYYYLSDQPSQSTHDAVAALNGGDEAAGKLRVNDSVKNVPAAIGAGLTCLIAVACFASPVRKITAKVEELAHA